MVTAEEFRVTKIALNNFVFAKKIIQKSFEFLRIGVEGEIKASAEGRPSQALNSGLCMRDCTSFVQTFGIGSC